MNKPLLLTALFFLICGTEILAQSSPTKGPIYDLSSPQQAIRRHLYYLQNDTYNLEYSAATIPGQGSVEEKGSAAIQLLQLYNITSQKVRDDLAPSDPNYIDSTTNLSRYTPFPGKYPKIYLEKNGGQWQYSKETIGILPELYASTIPGLTKVFKSILPEAGVRTFLGMKIWKWLGLLISIGLSFILYQIMDRSFAWSIRRILPRIFSNKFLNLNRVPPAAHVFAYLLLAFILREFLVPALILPIEIGRPIYILLSVAISVFGIWFLFRLIDILADIFESLADLTETTMDNQLVPLVSKISKMLVAVFGIIFILDNLEINVTALLAGVSIGGLALALAAQDTVRNFIGSITIFIDRPFTVGDFIEVAGISGTVLEVGVRSTRIRASDGALISIPNGDVANKVITNHSLRDYRRYATTITVSYDTLPSTLSNFVDKVKQIVIDHPKTRDDSVTVQFHEMSASSLDIFYAAIFEETGYAAWLEARQEIFLAIMKLAEEMGVGFAFPSTSVYIESMPQVKP